MKPTDWMASAACGQGTPWTFEQRPRQATLDALAGICADCPVRQECAQWAIDYRCDNGVYAGIWMPPSGQAEGRRIPHKQWRDAAAYLIVAVINRAAS